MKASSKKPSVAIPELQDWMAQYRASVGTAAEACLSLLQQLQQAGAFAGDGGARTRELLGVLQPLSPDPDTVNCAMLLAVEQSGAELGGILASLPAPESRLLDELHKLKRFETGGQASATERNAEGLRRLLLALVQDVRVVLVDLAWQLVQLRFAKTNPGRARELARETLLIHAPLANRLGVWQLKWELEDLSFRYQEPDEYQKIARLVAERRAERERFINDFMRRLELALADAGIRATVRGRPKHIYSIWRKMQRKGLDFHELFDVRAVRVLVDDVPACYSALGLVHTLWQPIPGEFDDYITTPKGNDYQSLHTAVSDEEGRAVEVQIRTQQMHEHAELGVAAHWRYKEGGPRDPAFEKKIAVMRQLIDLGDEELDDESLIEGFQSVTSEDRIYVLTPRGEVIDLVAGSTVLDFAYHVHTEVGHRCRGAKVNGRIVPLTQVVQTGDRVEILTGKQAAPSRDWLNPKLGFVHGARARGKVRQWFRKQGREANLRAGREMLDAEFRRLGQEPGDLEPLLRRFSQASVEDFYAAIGSGDMTLGQVVNAHARLRAEQVQPTAADLLTRRPVRQRGQPAEQPAGATIEGVGNLMTTMAKCCQPVPGDAVMGYVTRGRGVTIHREDCRQVLRWQRENQPRLLRVSWGGRPASNYPVRLALRAVNRRDLIRDISNVLSVSEAQVTDISSRLDEASDEVSIRLHVRVRDFGQLSELLSRLGRVPNVLEARRLAEGSTAAP